MRVTLEHKINYRVALAWAPALGRHIDIVYPYLLRMLHLLQC